jgi:hypothetical protein
LWAFNRNHQNGSGRIAEFAIESICLINVHPTAKQLVCLSVFLSRIVSRLSYSSVSANDFRKVQLARATAMASLSMDGAHHAIRELLEVKMLNESL